MPEKLNPFTVSTTSGDPLRITRCVDLPDALRILRYQKTPEMGPRLLFFSGGSALNPLSRRLVHFTHNSIHLTTPFDSGGSSGKLRRVIEVPAVGDLRSRLMALADQSIKGHREVYQLFSYRLPRDGSRRDLRERLRRFVFGEDELIQAVDMPMRSLICNHLRYFVNEMPESLDLRGANIGNLVLVGGYLNNARDLEPVVYLFAKMVEVRGTVLPIVSEAYDLAAVLENGATVLGQHSITGKEVPPIASPIRQLCLVDHLERGTPLDVNVGPRVRELILQADLICFPMGSFYTSIMANLLPIGVGSAVGANCCPKVYVPNTGCDPEQIGMKLSDCVATLVKYLQADPDVPRNTKDLLQFVLLDNRSESYDIDVDVERVQEMGVTVLRGELVTPQSRPHLDQDRVIATLLSMT